MKTKMMPVRVGRKTVGHVWRSKSKAFPYEGEHAGTGMSWSFGSKADAVATIKEHDARK